MSDWTPHADAVVRARLDDALSPQQSESEDVVKMRDRLDRYRFAMAREIEALAHERNQLKAINDRMAADRERLIAERDEARAQQQEQESVNAGLRRAYEHACEQRDKYQRRTAEWRQAAADVAVECNMYRDLAKDLYDHDPCSFDHHGGCQSHMFLEPGPGETCPDGRAQRLFEGGNDDANDQA